MTDEFVPRRNEDVCARTDGSGIDANDRPIVDDMLDECLSLIDEGDRDIVRELFSDEGFLGSRNYQKIAALSTFNEKSAGIVSFTGSGKTRIMLMSAALHCLFNNDGRVVVVVPQVRVRDEVKVKFDRLFEKDPSLKEIFGGPCVMFKAGDADKLWGPKFTNSLFRAVMGSKLIVVNVDNVVPLFEALKVIGWDISLMLGDEGHHYAEELRLMREAYPIFQPLLCHFSGTYRRERRRDGGILNCEVLFERNLAWGNANGFVKRIIFRFLPMTTATQEHAPGDADEELDLDTVRNRKLINFEPGMMKEFIHSRVFIDASVNCIVKSYIQKRALSRREHAAMIGDRPTNRFGKARIDGKWYGLDGLKQIAIVQTRSILQAKKVCRALRHFQVPVYNVRTKLMEMEYVKAEFVASNRRQDFCPNDKVENCRIMDLAHSCGIHFLVHVKIAGEGIDIVRCNMYAFLCPVKSKTQMIQGSGRALRPILAQDLSPCPSDNKALIIVPTIFNSLVEGFSNPNSDEIVNANFRDADDDEDDEDDDDDYDDDEDDDYRSRKRRRRKNGDEDVEDVEREGTVFSDIRVGSSFDKDFQHFRMDGRETTVVENVLEDVEELVRIPTLQFTGKTNLHRLTNNPRPPTEFFNLVSSDEEDEEEDKEEDEDDENEEDEDSDEDSDDDKGLVGEIIGEAVRAYRQRKKRKS
jgi:superfamily II DNA or RNA helicase